MRATIWLLNTFLLVCFPLPWSSFGVVDKGRRSGRSREIMSEVAIDALRVDLTRLLLSARSCGPAKGRPETDQIAQTTSLFRRCKQTGDASRESRSADGDAEAPDLKKSVATPPRIAPVAAAVSRRSPLPQEVDRWVVYLTRTILIRRVPRNSWP